MQTLLAIVNESQGLRLLDHVIGSDVLSKRNCMQSEPRCEEEARKNYIQIHYVVSYFYGCFSYTDCEANLIILLFLCSSGHKNFDLMPPLFNKSKQ